MFKQLSNANSMLTLKLLGWALFSVISLSYTVYIVSYLSLSFFEANGMIRDAQIREAFYYQVFNIEPVFFFMLLTGLVGVFLISFIFGNSQFNYFRRTARALEKYSLTSEVPSLKSLGPFSVHLSRFFQIMTMRLQKESDEKIKAAVTMVELTWPTRPKVSWVDQVQFAVIAALAAIFFSILAMIFFWKISDRIVELSGNLIRYKIATGPQFFTAQIDIVNLVMWSVFGVTIVAFGVTGFTFGKRVSEETYALLRDLRKFMEGDYNHRVFLRNDAPVKDLMSELNSSLQRLSDKLQTPNMSSSKSPTVPANV